MDLSNQELENERALFSPAAAQGELLFSESKTLG